MPLHKPYHSSMEKEIAKAASILNQFFDSKLSVDKAIPVELIQHCKGIAFLTVIKAGFLWSGKAGTGLVVARLDDGRWSAPSGIGTAGIGFGAEIGAEIVDFMIILGTTKSIQAFKKGTQLSVGAGLELAVGPFGRATGANLNAGSSGLSTNYTYSHAKGAFAGIGLHGSTILVRGDVNAKFYGRDVQPGDLLSGEVAPPRGACDFLYEAIARAERAGENAVNNFYAPCHASSYQTQQQQQYPHQQYLQQQQQQQPHVDGSDAFATHVPWRKGSHLSSRDSCGASADATPSMNTDLKTIAASERQSDPRLKRLGGYKSERELYAQFAANNQVEHQPKASPSSTSLNLTDEEKKKIATIPSPVQGEDVKRVFSRVMHFVSTHAPHADVQLFKDNCRLYGQDKLSMQSYVDYLWAVFTRNLLLDLVPDLVRLLPSETKRQEIWAVYTTRVLDDGSDGLGQS